MRLIVGLGFYALAVAFALLRGGGPERWFAGIMAGIVVVDRVGHLLLGGADLSYFATLHLSIDLTAFGAMMVVMIRARRLWPIWACSFQLLSVVSHTTWMMGDRLSPVIPAMLGIAPSYLICATLILGTVLHRVRCTRHGSDPSWRISSPRAIG
jgi:hypothetical protein